MSRFAAIVTRHGHQLWLIREHLPWIDGHARLKLGIVFVDV
jgi:hypothetical protein